MEQQGNIPRHGIEISNYAIINFMFLFFAQWVVVLPLSSVLGDINTCTASFILGAVTLILGCREFFEEEIIINSERFTKKNRKMGRISVVLYAIGLPIIYFYSFWIYLTYLIIILIVVHFLFYPSAILNKGDD